MTFKVHPPKCPHLKGLSHPWHILLPWKVAGPRFRRLGPGGRVSADHPQALPQHCVWAFHKPQFPYVTWVQGTKWAGVGRGLGLGRTLGEGCLLTVVAPSLHTGDLREMSGLGMKQGLPQPPH